MTRPTPRHPRSACRALLQALCVCVALLFMPGLTACHDDHDGPDNPVVRPDSVAQTVFMYFPWSGDLTNFFLTNIQDMEQVILQTKGQSYRFIVYFALRPDSAQMYEIVTDGKACKHLPLKTYTNPRHTTEQGLTAILSDMKAFAPAERYGMTIGCHGKGWLPVPRTNNAAAAPACSEADDGHVPLTRYFGDYAGRYLTDTRTLASSILSAGLHMDFILFDDCYMSSIEVAYDLKEATDYVIACPTEIMNYGMPYAKIGRHLLGTPNYQAVCDAFLAFYSTYVYDNTPYPYGTLGVTACQELDSLAAIMRTVHERHPYTEPAPRAVQRMDGYSPTLFYDFKDYVMAICQDDDALLTAFLDQFARTVPHSAHTPQFFANHRGAISIHAFGGVTTSASSQNDQAEPWTQTAWCQAISTRHSPGL